MRPIVTLTINPTIDAFCRTDRVVPVRKVRTRAEHYVPGGGGLNVSRVVRELGQAARLARVAPRGGVPHAAAGATF